VNKGAFSPGYKSANAVSPSYHTGMTHAEACEHCNLSIRKFKCVGLLNNSALRQRRKWKTPLPILLIGRGDRSMSRPLIAPYTISTKAGDERGCNRRPGVIAVRPGRHHPDGAVRRRLQGELGHISIAPILTKLTFSSVR
jgi:hypothetical protein